ncbi:hypothetical protein [Hydromonas duriensis]|uniref:Terminase small subunit n=1 Tax=Hydromonas duriensis TaxID=1527608 RepID=A0A4R6Y5H7_9BURK|nr:hypothetical protein [Hydromonas duriensis]TDR30668.1 hypothetical protein DFR44_11815 [Hydromonas duriensis]
MTHDAKLNASKPRKIRVAKKPTSTAIQTHLDKVRVPAPKQNDYAHGHGRTSLYKPEYVAAMLKYFDDGLQRCFEVGEDAQANSKIIATDFVTFNGFARTIGVSESTLKNWAHAVHEDGTLKYIEFFHAYGLCKDIQIDLVIRGGLTGAYKSGFATLAAMNIAGWKTQAETTNEHHHTGESVERLRKITEENQRKSQEMMSRVAQRRETAQSGTTNHKG